MKKKNQMKIMKIININNVEWKWIDNEMKIMCMKYNVDNNEVIIIMA